MGITIIEALMAELEPYTAAHIVCVKALMDVGVEEEADAPYTPDCKRAVATAAIKVLKKFLVLSSEGLGKSSQSYNVEGLKKRISELCKENGLDVSDYLEVPTISDGSNLW